MLVLVMLEEERGGGGGIGVFCSVSQRWTQVLARVVLKIDIQSRLQIYLRKFLMDRMVEVDRSCMTTVVDVAAACLSYRRVR